VRLIIGNKNYSSWSLRPWLLLDAFNLNYDEELVSLAQPNLSRRLKKYSASARVPVLRDAELAIWDSLAICEYINDAYLDGKAWPSDPKVRGIARAVTAEMHSGFQALRNEMPMNCRARRYVELSDAAKADIARVDDIWSEHAQVDSQGDMRLFGQFSIADCFFAPVVMRFTTYEPEISLLARAYLRSMRAHPSIQKWVASALEEDEIVEVDEAGTERS